MLAVELTRFRVKKGKTKVVDEWMQLLNEHMAETLVTLAREKMFVETIFREVSDGEEYLYWYSIQGQGGGEVESSEHWLDKKHLAYWQECIDPEYDPVNLSPEVIMIPANIRQEMV